MKRASGYFSDVGQNAPDFSPTLGSMRDDVTLEAVPRTKDSGGYATDAVTDVVTVPAQVIPLSGAEPFVAEALRGIVTHQVRIRFRSDVTAKSLVKWRGLTMQILQAPVNRDGRRRFLWLLCGLVEAA